MTVNTDLLELVVNDALRSVTGNLRWINAIKRGAELIMENRCVPQDDDTLLILSTSGHDYRVSLSDCRNEKNQLCPALRMERPCKHRAAFQLLVRYNERSRAA